MKTKFFRLWQSRSLTTQRTAKVKLGQIELQEAENCSEKYRELHNRMDLLYNGSRVSLPGVNRPGRGVDNTPTCTADAEYG
jgi:hypothetical protein